MLLLGKSHCLDEFGVAAETGRMILSYLKSVVNRLRSADNVCR
jgi:hypothetical protein